MMPVLIQGSKQPSNDIDVYLRPLVEELLQLWHEKGVRVWDEHKQEEFNLRALLKQEKCNRFSFQDGRPGIGKERWPGSHVTREGMLIRKVRKEK